MKHRGGGHCGKAGFELEMEIEGAVYEHYKKKRYRVLGTVRHSETLEELVLYETLYENDLGRTWVRPRAMFEESVLLDGKEIPRFRRMRESEVQIREWMDPRPAEIPGFEKFVSLHRSLFGEAFTDEVLVELPRRTPALLLLAMRAEEVVGFKLGHELRAGKFYSWSGGVAPAERGQGLGTRLMRAQHDWCRARGYRRVQTKTKNEWREMLLLNLKMGFQIVGTTADASGGPKIILEKDLFQEKNHHHDKY